MTLMPTLLLLIVSMMTISVADKPCDKWEIRTVRIWKDDQTIWTNNNCEKRVHDECDEKGKALQPRTPGRSVERDKISDMCFHCFYAKNYRCGGIRDAGEDKCELMTKTKIGGRKKVTRKYGQDKNEFSCPPKTWADCPIVGRERRVADWKKLNGKLEIELYDSDFISNDYLDTFVIENTDPNSIRTTDKTFVVNGKKNKSHKMKFQWISDHDRC